MKLPNRIMTDEELVKGCVEGKSKFQQALYNKFAPVMKGVCIRYSDTIEEAEDILQDGFIKVFLNLKNFRLDGSLEGWVRRIMVNTALNYYRAKQKSSYHANIDEIVEIVEDVRIDNYDKLNTKVLLQMIEELPPGYRMVFNMFEIEGYSHKEIADELNVSVNTSKSQLLKARRSLQQKINELTESENKKMAQL
ncbi:MAG: sigma-70 family RNA polymerase sigma factor [Bacteroidales bacterium]|nr:sigma-70 family RNA polymerase sigma factor [Bacteroidales bacterium]MDY0216606.1 sigma-70 family RNA polymerase sigma factor [Bacteroidales bacterium]